MPNDDDQSVDASAPTAPGTILGAASLKLPERYEERALIGRGGMGEIFLARDHQLGRDVALKAGHVDGTEDLRRFVREYRLQGRLEHPGIVPVYDVGTLPDGSPFFTMKRVRGETLEEVLARLARHDPEAESKYSRARLLGLFVTMAQSVHYAHTHGVIHRDLKPANVIVGDFGEIYVIDWGIAKLVATDDPPLTTRPSNPPRPPALHEVLDVEQPTQSGELLGTLGYMAPEQITDASSVDARADVYALGAILFEILTLERLHAKSRAVDIVESTLRGSADRIREITTARGAPPELVDICVRATDNDLSARSSSVSDVFDAVQRFLDGDRDLESRAKIADEEVALAIEAASRRDRAMALKHAGRTLAIDPAHPIAQQVIVRLMVEMPGEAEEPPEIEKTVERDAVRLYRRGGLAGALLFAAWLPFVIAFSLADPMQPLVVIGWGVTVLVSIALLFANSRVRRRGAALYFATLVACVASTTMATRIVGPFVSVPGVVTLTLLTFVLLGKRAWHAPAIAIGAIGLATPIVVERWRLVTPTTVFDERGMHLKSPAVYLSPDAGVLALAGGTLMVYLVVCAAGSFFQRLLVTNARRAALQSWKLSSLVPGDRQMLDVPPSSTMRRG